MNEILLGIVAFCLLVNTVFIAVSLLIFKLINMRKKLVTLHVLIGEEGRIYSTAGDPKILEDFVEKFQITDPSAKIVRLDGFYE